jgi:hypothetical protein
MPVSSFDEDIGLARRKDRAAGLLFNNGRYGLLYIGVEYL